MSILEIGKHKNLTQMIVNLVNEHFKNNTTPFIVNNKNFPIIEESAYIINRLEKEGYKIKEFSNKGEYGLEVSK
jgi:hypothetical protein